MFGRKKRESVLQREMERKLELTAEAACKFAQDTPGRWVASVLAANGWVLLPEDGMTADEIYDQGGGLSVELTRDPTVIQVNLLLPADLGDPAMAYREGARTVLMEVAKALSEVGPPVDSPEPTYVMTSRSLASIFRVPLSVRVHRAASPA